MTIKNLSEELSGCAYPGRGIVAGMSEDGKKAVSAYFIMGRSESSRNRVFVQAGEGIRTEAFDPSTLLVAPELIIYAPVRVLGNNTIVTNGDQTDTVYDGLSEGKTFEESLRVRKYEHDAPNYTPRISSVLHVENNEYSYAMSILKSHNGNPDTHIHMMQHLQEKDIISIHIWVMAIHFQAMRENLHGLRYQVILKNSHR